MANTNNNSARQVHVSPGIYTKETDLTYASKSLGITTLGLVGETVKGPAFQPIAVDSWRSFVSFFGGTNPEKFVGTQYPKYELPYIAKSYLEESQQLQVCRVLGLSGVNAGAAWLLTAAGDGNSEYTDDNPLVIAVLRSRGEHRKAAFLAAADPDNGICEDQYEFDKIVYYAKNVRVIPSSDLNLSSDCNPGFSKTKNELTMNVLNYGTFTLQVDTEYGETKNYAVTLNPSDKNYILNVLGTSAETGDCEIFVEELYDVAIKQLIERGDLTHLAFATSDEPFELYHYDDIKLLPSHKPVYDLLVEDESMLNRKYVGRRFLYSSTYSVNSEDPTKGLKVHISADKGRTWIPVRGLPGHIYTVVPYTTKDGAREYYYGEYVTDTIAEYEVKNDTFTIDGRKYDLNSFKVNGTLPNEIEVRGVRYGLLHNNENKVISVFTLTDIFNYDGGIFYPSTVRNFESEYLSSEHVIDELTNTFSDVVEVLSDNMLYIAVKDDDVVDVKPITLDLNNYKSQYRYASTPWIVSEMKGSAEHVELTKLFRFHTISDGTASNTEVKVSLANIDPINGTFDVLVRSFYDTDGSPSVLERYMQCDLIPGSSNYIALKIGSTDESYETKSKYITVEVNETDITKISIPAGFLGYPVRYYDGTIVTRDGTSGPRVQKPYFQYNTNVDDEIRINKQYFGISDLTGIDEDILRYKGVEAYNELPEGLSPCFHLDSRILGKDEKTEALTQTVSVDGIEYDNWVTVGKGNVTDFGLEPRLGSEDVMLNTIYEDKRYRKFTVAFYGGWDGWDYYRTQRSNTDDFTYNKYRGKLDKTSGEGTSFSVLRDGETYGFDDETKAITSDWYAYLSAIRQFANPKAIDINILATPGIDYVNNKLLVDEVIDMVEVDRADSVYVVTTPDKPSGASDDIGQMYTADDVVANLEDSDIDSNYTCTFYPWVKYYDADNSQYLYLPVTKDIVRNFAYTDNTTYPWFAAAGWNRGTVQGVKPKKNLKLGEQDTLYGGRINFINSFPDEGMKLWGDKNLQIRESQMNRISKRRLLVRIRKLLSIACIGLIFDPNDNTTAQAFKSAVDPILQDIVSKRGLTDYRIEVDTSQEARDRLELPAKIFLKLQPNLEYISIDLTISPSGASFDDI